MAKKKAAPPTPLTQDDSFGPLFDFAATIEKSEVFSKEKVSATSHTGECYSPVEETAHYMARAVRFEEVWETKIAEARDQLLVLDARQIYLDFFDDVVAQANQGGAKGARLVGMLEHVGVRGLGMTREMMTVDKTIKGGSGAAKVRYDKEAARDHVERHVLGEHFLNLLSADGSTWNGRSPLIAASDVSQHRSAVPVPARYFQRSVPFVLNNAAGAIFRLESGSPKYDNVFNPKPDDSLLRWMLIDPSYRDELESEDYQRCLASAMDVGHYKFDLGYLMQADKRPPDIIFRDGSLFPQDAYLDNYVLDNKRGEFTREAIKDFLSCLQWAEEMPLIYCGVSKNVQLKLYSSVLDWYISKYIDQNWDFGSYTFNDGEAMSLLLACGSFVGDNLSSVISTCQIVRSFTTRANLNTKVQLNQPGKLDQYFHEFQQKNCEIDITPFKRLCEKAQVAIFFMGHSKNPQQRLPRYEYFTHNGLGPLSMVPHRILGGLQACGIAGDNDHSFMAEEPITYILPQVTQQAHLLSKDVGKYIDRATGQYIMARYKKLVTKQD